MTPAYARLAETHGLEPIDGFRPGPVTPLLAKGGALGTRTWTESEALNARYRVTASPFQDLNWLRQFFAPTFVDWLAHSPPEDFSFELAYGSLLCSIEEDDPGEPGLVALWRASAAVADRIRAESAE